MNAFFWRNLPGFSICRGEEVASGKLPRRRLARSEVLTQARARCVQLREGHFSCAAVVNLTQDGPKRRRVEAGKSWCYRAGVPRKNAHQAEGVEMVETCSNPCSGNQIISGVRVARCPYDLCVLAQDGSGVEYAERTCFLGESSQWGVEAPASTLAKGSPCREGC